MVIVLGPKNVDAERALMHSLLAAAPDEDSLEQSFWEPSGPVLCTKEFADEYSLMHYRRGGEKKTENHDESDRKNTVANETTELSPEEEKAIEDRIENNRFVEGSRAFKENADFMNKVDNFGKLNRDDRRSVEKEIIRRMDEDFSLSDAYWKRTADDLDAEHGVDAENEYDRLMDSLRNNFDRLSPQAKEYAAKAAVNLSTGDIYSPGLADIGNSGGKVSWWIEERMDKLSGNMNGNQWKPGSRGEKAAKLVDESWKKEEARAKEVARDIGVEDGDAWWNPSSRDYKKMQQALKSDSLYQAMKENSNKSGEALVKAVAQDMGFPLTPGVLHALEWYVWRD